MEADVVVWAEYAVASAGSGSYSRPAIIVARASSDIKLLASSLSVLMELLA